MYSYVLEFDNLEYVTVHIKSDAVLKIASYYHFVCPPILTVNNFGLIIQFILLYTNPAPFSRGFCRFFAQEARFFHQQNAIL